MLKIPFKPERLYKNKNIHINNMASRYDYESRLGPY